MKFFKYFLLLATIYLIAFSCKKEDHNIWKIDVKSPPVTITDLSGEYFNQNTNFEAFKTKYPWFQGSNTNEEYETRRKDTLDINIYRSAIKKIDQPELEKELGNLFGHIKYYYPQFNAPKVFLYSSALQGIMNPIIYQSEKNFLFVDISAFMGYHDQHYKGLDLYFQKSMNPENIVPKISRLFAENLFHQDPKVKFLDKIIDEGKIMTMQDAFLPDTPDYLKINYTPLQYDWAKANEVNIWNYFIEHNLLFSDDPQLDERFLNVAPFSKFYTEIDQQSSPQIGIWSGWQICRKYLNKKPDIKLQDFLKTNDDEIFNQSHYKPIDK